MARSSVRCEPLVHENRAASEDEVCQRRSFLKIFVGGAVATTALSLANCGGHADSSSSQSPPPVAYDVTAYGATGDGSTLDSIAINSAIQAASTAGGGVVRFPSGDYLSYSIRLQSNITLQLEQGVRIIGADISTNGGPGYDPPEAGGPWTAYQDFVHNFYHNSLIWGVDLDNVSIIGPGLIWGRGLNTGGTQQAGTGNKAIALKNCTNVVLRDLSLIHI